MTSEPDDPLAPRVEVLIDEYQRIYAEEEREAIAGKDIARWRNCDLNSLRMLLAVLLKRHDDALTPAPAAPQEVEPNIWKCQTCGFVVVKAVLSARTGNVGIDRREVQDVCPNDGTSLRQQTVRESCDEAVKHAIANLDRALVAEAALQQTAQQLQEALTARDEAQQWIDSEPDWKAQYHKIMISVQQRAESAEAALLARTQERDALPAAQWQPIATAPKDGGAFIAACAMDAFRAFYDLEQEVWVCEDDGLWFGALRFPPTHWMPLPAPPEAP